MSIPTSEIARGDLVWVRNERIRGKVMDILHSSPWPFGIKFHDREEICYFPASDIMLVQKEKANANE